MYNTFQYNTSMYNTLGAGAEVVTTTDPKFNDYVFGGAIVDNDYTIANYFDADNAPDRDLVTSPIPRQHGETILSDYWRAKTIRVSGAMSAINKSSLDAKLHEMKNALKKQDGILEWQDTDRTLQAICNWTNSTITYDRANHYNLTFGKYDLEFKAFKPCFAQEVNYSSRSFFDRTELEFTEQIQPSGTAPMSPIFILIFSQATSITKIKIELLTTGESIETVPISILAGDILEFNAETLRVLHNGVIIDYDGFPFNELQNGVNTFKVTLAGTSATYSLTAKYKNYYL